MPFVWVVDVDEFVAVVSVMAVTEGCEIFRVACTVVAWWDDSVDGVDVVVAGDTGVSVSVFGLCACVVGDGVVFVFGLDFVAEGASGLFAIHGEVFVTVGAAFFPAVAPGFAVRPGCFVAVSPVEFERGEFVPAVTDVGFW